MDWEIKKRGRVTYYRKKSNDVFSDLVVEELDNGDLKIRFVGMLILECFWTTGGGRKWHETSCCPWSGTRRLQGQHTLH